ncbi:hypothetical protein CCR94_03150 [Rhodoblastus sphagnicola]|uniref:Uncharacterized protein n=1 Tax=Rhodoblastus sphagnicola TaxID=333368 RepID=A0A2S6NEG1_9HYPH|nr:WGR domain-containing protein [Rhodoblastus sphagnicola]MBB4200169.1 putative DNA-binding WGR domain protein [Rhodoblastus sphagnicola]PPQ32987.1 hypothetical protein CCR94_03150 [Rhodoblastus sphagnicola]
MTRPAVHQLHLERIDTARTMWRGSEREVHSTLFGEHALARTWGRIDTPGRHMIGTFTVTLPPTFIQP